MAIRFSTSISLGGNRVEHPPREATKAWRKANSIFVPLGYAYTHAWVVMTYGNIQPFDINQPQILEWKQDTLESVYDVDSKETEVGQPTTTKTLSFQGLYIKSAERIFAGGDSDPHALYLVELVDSRYLAAMNSDTAAIVSNLRSYANNADFLTGTTTYGTWETLVSALWSACAKLGAYPGLPGGLPIDGAPNNNWFIGLNAYSALNAVLDLLDCALQPDPFALTPTYSIVQLGASQTIAANSSSLQWNGQPLSPAAVKKAASLNIYHHKYLKSYGQEKDTELADNWAYNGNHSYSTVTTDIAGGAGSTALWDDLPVIVGEDGQNTNDAAITTRNNNRKARYVTRQNVDEQHRIHYGLYKLDYLPGGKIRACLWRNWGDADSNDLGGTVTEFVCCPELITGVSALDDNRDPVIGNFARYQSDVSREVYLPPDFNRHTFPNYPRLPNIVQVWHSGGATAGQSLDPDGTNSNGVKLHSGRVKKYINGTITEYDNCWILFTNSYDGKGGNIKAKEGSYHGPARLSGITTCSGVTKPTYVVSKSLDPDESLVVFQLVETLPLFGSAAAVLCNLDTNTGLYTAGSQAVIVTDGVSRPDAPPGTTSSFGRWSGLAGYRGLAFQRADGLYEIVDMERNALIVEFTVYAKGSIGATSFLVTMDNQYQQGGRPSYPGPNPSPLTVWDERQLFPRRENGGKGLAIWNDKADRYDCLVVQQTCILGHAQINNAQGGINGDIGYVSITGFTGISPSPFNSTPNPLPTNAINWNGFRCKDSDDIVVAWSQQYEDWIVLQNMEREQGMVVRPQQDINKGTTNACTVVHPAALNGRTVQCNAKGAKVFYDKLCSTWTDPNTGETFVAPWE